MDDGYVVHVNKTTQIKIPAFFFLSPQSLNPVGTSPNRPAGRPESQRERVGGKIGSFCRSANNEVSAAEISSAKG